MGESKFKHLAEWKATFGVIKRQIVKCALICRSVLCGYSLVTSSANTLEVQKDQKAFPSVYI